VTSAVVNMTASSATQRRDIIVAFPTVPPNEGNTDTAKSPSSVPMGAIDAGAPADEVVGAWDAELAAFEGRRRPYLIYPRIGR
jgi:hypothetical protein